MPVHRFFYVLCLGRIAYLCKKDPYMKKTLILSTLVLSLSATNSAHAFASLASLFGGGSDNKEQSQSQSQSQNQSPIASNPLVSMLTSNLGVSSNQAAAGAGALLAVAASKLSTSENSEIDSMIPGLKSLTGSIPGGLGKMLLNMDSVKNTFSALGLSPEIIPQFTPLITQFLKEKNAKPELINALDSVWK